jgi:hypothetical protein
MLHYPKIGTTEGCPGGRCIAFEKIDGTNLHWDWDREFGWHAFGTRRDAFDLTPTGVEAFHHAHPGLGRSVALFEAHLAEPLERIFRDAEPFRDVASFKAFTEYAGPRSFAGTHHPGDEAELVLFDVEAEGLGLIGPEAFVEHFGHLRIPRVVFRGRFTGKLTEDVRKGKFGVAEGVVLKGGATGQVWMAKVKTDAYRARLEASFGQRWQQYWE